MAPWCAQQPAIARACMRTHTCARRRITRRHVCVPAVIVRGAHQQDGSCVLIRSGYWLYIHVSVITYALPMSCHSLHHVHHMHHVQTCMLREHESLPRHAALTGVGCTVYPAACTCSC